jgi:hypothetical protein
VLRTPGSFNVPILIEQLLPHSKVLNLPFEDETHHTRKSRCKIFLILMLLLSLDWKGGVLYPPPVFLLAKNRGV